MQSKQIRVLHILNGLNVGGAEAFLKNLRTAFSDENIKMDFLLRSNRNNPETMRYFEDYGAQVAIMPPFPAKALSNYHETAKYLKTCNRKYDAVHIHANSLFYYFPIKAVQKYMPDAKIIVHSHNSDTKSAPAKKVHKFNKWRLKRKKVTRIACSCEAGEWMFGSCPFQVVNNAIDLNVFENSKNMRGGAKKSCGIDSELLICVGRLVPEKNHVFLIPVMKELVKTHPDIKLVICGDGSLKDELQETINEEKLNNNIQLMGNRSDIAELLKASDVFLMPSVYEGIGISAIEAQATGIPSVLSDRIPPGVGICPNVSMIPLEPELWVKEIESALSRKNFRFENTELLKEAGYGLESLKERMLEVYLGE